MLKNFRTWKRSLIREEASSKKNENCSKLEIKNMTENFEDNRNPNFISDKKIFTKIWTQPKRIFKYNSHYYSSLSYTYISFSAVIICGIWLYCSTIISLSLKLYLLCLNRPSTSIFVEYISNILTSWWYY